MSTFDISLDNLRFTGHIGVAEQERIVGNDFRVDVVMTIDASDFKSEDISTTISYAEAYEVISGIMRQEWLLLESVAVTIAGHLRDKWPQILNIMVKVTKLSVPVSGISGVCAVQYKD